MNLFNEAPPGWLDGRVGIQVTAMAVHHSDILSVAGGRIGISSAVMTEVQAVGLTLLEQTAKLEPMRIRSNRGIKEKGAMASISVLPFSRLFMVGTEDGVVKICH
eukprot:1177257-Prorocentrum_minimum.AAC.5